MALLSHRRVQESGSWERLWRAVEAAWQPAALSMRASVYGLMVTYPLLLVLLLGSAHRGETVLRTVLAVRCLFPPVPLATTN
jgi:hypothetical protein